MANRKYTDREATDFLDLAKKIGISPALKELGYPANRATVYFWMKKYNVTITLDTLRQAAAEANWFYHDREQLQVLSMLLERIYEELSTSLGLRPEDAAKYARAAKDTIESMRLIGGQNTSKVEVDTVDLELKRLVDEFKEKASKNNDSHV